MCSASFGDANPELILCARGSFESRCCHERRRQRLAARARTRADFHAAIFLADHSRSRRHASACARLAARSRKPKRRFFSRLQGGRVAPRAPHARTRGSSPDRLRNFVSAAAAASVQSAPSESHCVTTSMLESASNCPAFRLARDDKTTQRASVFTLGLAAFGAFLQSDCAFLFGGDYSAGYHSNSASSGSGPSWTIAP